MAPRSASICSIALLLLNLLFTGVVSTAAVRFESDGTITGTRRLLQIGVIPTEPVNKGQELVEESSSPAKPARYIGTARLVGVVPIEGINTRAQLSSAQIRKRKHGNRRRKRL